MSKLDFWTCGNLRSPLSIFLAEMERVTPPISLYLHPTAAGWGPLCARMLVFAGNMLAVRLFHFGNILCTYRSVWYSGNPFLLPSYPGGGVQSNAFPGSLYSRTRGNVSRHQNYYKLRQFVPFYSHARGNVRFCPVGVRSYSALSMYSSRPPPGCGGLFCIRSSSAMV